MLKIINIVRDHCYQTGEYKGAVNGVFNLKYSIPQKITIIVYN